ncbi:histidine phosphatase family protein [Paenibacillus sp. NPDC056722]|uniref:histidine phosphatase family protein n=1 Tax=Paenibacillus sp. NPDC056722 TaxID=3345924 RepID=UPI0036987F23
MGVYFLRHGADEEGYRGGWSMRGLTDLGLEQSEQLGNFLLSNTTSFNIRHIISSDLTRALETAERIADKLALDIEESIVWRETNNGVLAGMPNEAAEKLYPGLYFSSLQWDQRYPGGESPKENFARIEEAFQQLCATSIAQSSTENVLVVTHGGVINIIYHILKGLKWSNTNKFFPADNASLHKIEFRGDRWELSQENIVS